LATNPISGRPAQPPAPQPAAGEARAAAQRAFFQAALAKVGAPAAPAQVAAPQPAQAQGRAVEPVVTRVRDEVPIPPQPNRILRPGSLLDIKV